MSENELVTTESYGIGDWPSIYFPNPQIFICEKHGEIESIIDSSIKGHEGKWCQICWIESLDKLGVCRVTKKE